MALDIQCLLESYYHAVGQSQVNYRARDIKMRILHGGAKIRILFSNGKTIFYERAQRVNKILFLPREEKRKFISSSRRVMIFLLYRQKDINKIIEGNDRNYVIDKLTCEIMENKPLGSRMQFL